MLMVWGIVGLRFAAGVACAFNGGKMQTNVLSIEQIFSQE